MEALNNPTTPCNVHMGVGSGERERVEHGTYVRIQYGTGGKKACTSSQVLVSRIGHVLLPCSASSRKKLLFEKRSQRGRRRRVFLVSLTHVPYVLSPVHANRIFYLHTRHPCLIQGTLWSRKDCNPRLYRCRGIEAHTSTHTHTHTHTYTHTHTSSLLHFLHRSYTYTHIHISHTSSTLHGGLPALLGVTLSAPSRPSGPSAKSSS